MLSFAILFFIQLLIHEGIHQGVAASSVVCTERVRDLEQMINLNCPSDYLITAERQRDPSDESMLVTIQGLTLNAAFTDIIVLAKDNRDNLIGGWTTTDPSLQIMPCGEVMHTNSNELKNQVKAIWHPSSDARDQITIQTMIRRAESTVFCRCEHKILYPNKGFQKKDLINRLSLTTTVESTTTQTPSPTANVGINVTWVWNADNSTRIYMSIMNMKSSQWAAIGFSPDGSMGSSHVFICRRQANDTVDINRYINPDGHAPPESAGSEQGGVFNAERQTLVNGMVTCQFTLSKFDVTFATRKLRDVVQLSPSTPYHPLIAIGQVDSSNVLKRHAGDSRTGLTKTVQLNRAESITFHITPSNNDDDTDKYLRAHGGLMVFTWILLVSTGIIFARYFKNSWPDRMICGKNVWFASHRLLMSVAAVSTLLGFFFVFVYNDGKWVTGDKPRAHAITGIIVIGFAFIQPFIALFRCEPNSTYRFIFNYIHAFVGFVAFILSMAALMLATVNFKGIFSTNTGWIVMVAWICWMVIISIIFEWVQRRSDSAHGSLNKDSLSANSVEELRTSSFPLITGASDSQSQQQRLKNILLALHICVATGVSIALFIPILRFK